MANAFSMAQNKIFSQNSQNLSDSVNLINYFDEVHILNTEVKTSTDILGKTTSINTLASEELIGSKINALLTRTTPRDVYDAYNIFNSVNVTDGKLVKKIEI